MPKRVSEVAASRLDLARAAWEERICGVEVALREAGSTDTDLARMYEWGADHIGDLLSKAESMGRFSLFKRALGME